MDKRMNRREMWLLRTVIRPSSSQGEDRLNSPKYG